MRERDWFVLKQYSKNMNLHPYHLEIIMRSLEFYLLVVRQQYNDNFLTTKQYDDIYFELYLLYNTFMYSLAEIPNTYRPLTIELYKRIDTRERFEKSLEKFKTA